MRAFLILLLLAVSALGLEFTLREQGILNRVDQTAFPGKLGDLKPNQQVISTEVPEWPYFVRVNREGLRGEELKPWSEGRYRILLLGGSFVFGQLVHEDQTLTASLQGELNRLPSPWKFEVINGGRCGYSIEDHLSYFADRGYRLEAQQVVLIYTIGEEIKKAWGIRQRRDSLRRGRFRSGHSPLRLVENLFRQIATLYWLQARYGSWSVHHGKPFGSDSPLTLFSPYDDPLQPLYQEALRDYVEDLLRLRNRVEGRGAQFHWVLFPSDLQMERDRSPLPQAFLLAEVGGQRIRTTDLLPILRAHGSRETLYYQPRNGHPQPLAYSIAAQALAPELATFAQAHPPFLSPNACGRVAASTKGVPLGKFTAPDPGLCGTGPKDVNQGKRGDLSY